MVRRGSSILGGVVPIGDPFGAGRVLRAVRLRDEGAARCAHLHGRTLVVGHVEVLASTGGRVLGAARLSGSRLGRRGSTATLVRSASRDAERGSNGGYPAAPARGLGQRADADASAVGHGGSVARRAAPALRPRTHDGSREGVRTYVLSRAEVGGVCARARPHDELRDGRTRTRELRGGAAA